MNERRVTATPYRIGTSVSSVELLLEARTAAEGVLGVVGRQLAANVRVDGPATITGVVPGPGRATMRFVAEARTGPLGALLAEPGTVVRIADLIIGGRGKPEDRLPSALEVELFSAKLLDPVSTILDAVAPGRPEALALSLRDEPAAARSMLVNLAVNHGDAPLDLAIEVLAHHVADDIAEIDTGEMEAIAQDVPLEMSFRFAPVHLHARDVAALRPGDVICLEHEADQPVTGQVDGRPLVKGRVGVSGRHAAVEVVELVDRSS